MRNIMYIIHEKGEFVYKKNGGYATSCPLANASIRKTSAVADVKASIKNPEEINFLRVIFILAFYFSSLLTR